MNARSSNSPLCAASRELGFHAELSAEVAFQGGSGVQAHAGTPAVAPAGLSAVLDSFPVARYRIDCEAVTRVQLPAFAGSTLRGVLGMALRDAVCVTRVPNCEGCALLASCVYACVFEPRPPRPDHPLQDFNQIPRPYVIEPPMGGERSLVPGDTFSFQLVLAGRALAHLAILLWAFAKGLQDGVGKGGGRVRLNRVWHVSEVETEVLASLSAHLVPHSQSVETSFSGSATAVTLHFDTPLRLQNNGRRATADEHTPRRLLTALMRRVSLMSEFHGGGPLPCDFRSLATQADNLRAEKDLSWQDWSRYSSRQHQKMELGGVVGRWTLRGELTPFLPFLLLGQWLHVGKEAAFGLGAYRLELQS